MSDELEATSTLSKGELRKPPPPQKSKPLNKENFGENSEGGPEEKLNSPQSSSQNALTSTLAAIRAAPRLTQQDQDGCRHCGLPLPQRPIQRESNQFCCQACAMVFSFIHQQGFQSYYQMRPQGIKQSAPPTWEDNQSHYAHLDQPETRRHYTGPQGLRMTFFLEGIHCSACLWLIEKLPEMIAEVTFARLNLQKNLLSVEILPTGSFANVASTLHHLGYRPHPIQSEKDADEWKQKQQRRWLRRLGVAGFTAGNIMLLSIALYGGADGSYYTLFRWLSLALFIPTFFYSAWPFYENTWRAIRQRRPSIDLPITIALWAGTVLSLYHLITKTGDHYFDSLSVLIFLLLATRYALYRIQSQSLSSSQFFEALHQPVAHRWNPISRKYETVLSSQVQIGDLIEVRSEERLPADGILQSSEALIDSSVLTGESLPQTFRRQDLCFAGTQLMTGTVHVSVTATGRECRMGQILTRLEERSRHVSPLVTQADHWAQNFTYGVILVASLFTISSWPFLYEESVLRALALIIVACPCAMAFGAPLALSLSLKRAARSGFLIKDAETLEKLAQIQTIVFDKTGTLTEGKMKVVAWSPTHPPLKIMSIIAALEEDSVHPVGRALYKEAKEQGFLNVPLKLRQWEEIRGQGVRGWWEKDLYEIKSCDNHSNTTWSNQPFSLTSTVGIFRNGELLYKCALGDRVRPEAKAVVQDLMNSGYAVHLLSGDQTSVVKALATDLGIPNTQALAKQSPEAKEQYLEQIPKALMIGDGANDALALQAAHVGAALHGSVELSLQAADLYIFRSGLAPVLDLLNSARQAITAVRRNLAISIVYNGGFGFCALMGWVEPLAAALLMPMSSIIILLTTLHSTRTIKAKLTS